jgi:hypothetical protein
VSPTDAIRWTFLGIAVVAFLGEFFGYRTLSDTWANLIVLGLGIGVAGSIGKRATFKVEAVQTPKVPAPDLRGTEPTA